MTEKPSDPEQSAPPEDIATLYARARTPGSTYWDFSASRKEVLGRFRYRIVREPGEAGSATEPTVISQRSSHQATEEAPQLVPQGSLEATETQALPEPARQTGPQPMDAAATRWFALHSIFAPPEEI